ncbi:MAG: TolC family protein [Bacteroidota bacterium]
MKAARLILSVLFLVVFGPRIHAQNNTQPDLSQPWTLQQCILYARENNIQIRQSELSVQLAQINLLQSKGNTLPSINGNISHMYNFGRTIDPFTNQFATDKVLSDNFSVSGSITLFSGFQNYNTILESNYAYLAAKYDLEKMRNDISLNIATVYLQILFADELVAIAKGQVDITKLQVERVQKLVDAGSLPKSSLFDIQAQLASEELNLVNAENQLSISYLNLQQLLDLQSPLKIVKPELDIPSSDVLALSPSHIYGTALSTMPEIKSAEYKMLSAQRGYKAAMGGYSPRLTLSGSYGTGYSGASKSITSFTYSGNDTIGFTASTFDPVLTPHLDYTYQTTPFKDQIDQNLNKSIGLSLTVPLFNRFSVYSSARRAKISQLNAQYSLDLAKNQLEKSVQQAYADAVAALKKYNASLKTVSAMEESFKYTEQKFNVNLINSFDYNEAKNRLAKAKSDLLQAKYDYIFKLKILDFYQGKQLTL